MNAWSERISSGRIEPSRLNFHRPWRTPFLIFTSMTLATLVGLILWVVAVITLFRARRFCAEVIAARLGKVILRVWGIRLEIHQDRPLPTSQTIYISNHTSTLDVIILLALGLPNARFIMWRGTRKWPPVMLLGHAIGIFFTPPQKNRLDRVQCFQMASRVLRRNKESVYLSPEGARITSGEIGPFNKGAFHLATELKAPIVPLYIDIPHEVDPGLGLAPLPGTVHLYQMPVICTCHWTLDQLEENKERVRQQYVEMHRALKSRGQ